MREEHERGKLSKKTLALSEMLMRRSGIDAREVMAAAGSVISGESVSHGLSLLGPKLARNASSLVDILAAVDQVAGKVS